VDAVRRRRGRRTLGTAMNAAPPVPAPATGAVPRRRDRRTLVANVGARVGSLVALGVATVVVARGGGPAAVGLLALLRVLPGLAGVLVSCGLPGAVPYFLAAEPGSVGADRATVRATLLWLDGAGAVAAAAGWLLLTPLLHRAFFSVESVGLVAWAATAVLTQQPVAVGKALLQGSDDLRGANAAILAEEAAFLPAYLLLAPALHGPALLLAALVAADVAVAAGIYARLWRRGFLAGLPGAGWPRSRPQWRLARDVSRYGLRGQIGNVLLLLNLRLDFALLGALAGPAVLGVYAVASKYAELLRLPGLAISYVLYPRFARQGPAVARARTRRLLPRATAVTAAAAVPLGLAAPLLLPLLYGREFTPAVRPAGFLLAGLVLDGAAGLVTAYLYATRRPGRNSLAMGAGVLVTAVLDLALIPGFGVTGAAVASALAYLTTAAALIALFAVGDHGRQEEGP
jgi:O-antigen/teichoic acid export membrane protein